MAAAASVLRNSRRATAWARKAVPLADKPADLAGDVLRGRHAVLKARAAALTSGPAAPAIRGFGPGARVGPVGSGSIPFRKPPPRGYTKPVIGTPPPRPPGPMYGPMAPKPVIGAPPPSPTRGPMSGGRRIRIGAPPAASSPRRKIYDGQKRLGVKERDFDAMRRRSAANMAANPRPGLREAYRASTKGSKNQSPWTRRAIMGAGVVAVGGLASASMRNSGPAADPGAHSMQSYREPVMSAY